MGFRVPSGAGVSERTRSWGARARWRGRRRVLGFRVLNVAGVSERTRS